MESSAISLCSTFCAYFTVTGAAPLAHNGPALISRRTRTRLSKFKMKRTPLCGCRPAQGPSASTSGKNAAASEPSTHQCQAVALLFPRSRSDRGGAPAASHRTGSCPQTPKLIDYRWERGLCAGWSRLREVKVPTRWPSLCNESLTPTSWHPSAGLHTACARGYTCDLPYDQSVLSAEVP
jgi:hypothetical protein